MMKKNLAKILVLVLIVSLLVPAMANADGNYKATLTLTGPDATGTAQTASAETGYVADTTTIEALILSFGDVTETAEEYFAGTGLRAQFDAYKAAAENGGSSWAALIDGADIDPAAAKEVLADQSKTVADLIAVSSTIKVTLVVNGKTYTARLSFAAQGAGSGSGGGGVVSGGGGAAAPAASASPEAEVEEEPVVVDGSDITEDEPVVIEEAVAVADSAEEAAEIQIENIPEEVQEIALEVALEAAEDAEVSENTTVLAIKDKDGNVTIIPMAVISVDEDGNITAKGSLSEELTEALKDGGSVIAFDNAQDEFTDVTEALENETITQEEADAVAYWQARGVVEGVGDGKLGDIGEEVDRARFVTLLNRAFGSPSAEATADYADLTGKFEYAKDAASWAAEAGLMNGIGDDEDGNALFGTGSIEAWQMALIMYRALGNNDSSEDYSDSWNWAVKNGLISGEKDATPAMPALLLMMQNLAAYLDGAKMEGDSDLETTALDAAE